MEKYLITEFDTFGRKPIISKSKDRRLICLFLTGGPTESSNKNVAAYGYIYAEKKMNNEPEKARM